MGFTVPLSHDVTLGHSVTQILVSIQPVTKLGFKHRLKSEYNIQPYQIPEYVRTKKLENMI